MKRVCASCECLVNEDQEYCTRCGKETESIDDDYRRDLAEQADTDGMESLTELEQAIVLYS